MKIRHGTGKRQPLRSCFVNHEIASYHTAVLIRCSPCGVSFLVSVPIWTFIIRDGNKGLPQSSHDNRAGYPQSYDHHVALQDSCHSYSHFRRSGQHPRGRSMIQASTREDQALPEEEEIETESDGEVECDLSNMEITEELRQYFAETERHREERRRQQQLDAERLQDYVNADHDLYNRTRRSVKPPTERPGERRRAEMKRLYGDSATKIQAIETAMQLSFDKHCDRKQPKYWPVIPLKF
ncbi:PREDICTED: gem-associated protein 8 isoform X2 [Galeopterus variegatus]|uniref:Gem-associated protein 8 isoform X2 n=1 Tax=Galeopterus variegatus TaxID=482537 RepID=A0ABM0S508_GALVR|nr:PREDICTED: gem-associated protein 8 isoform X2 [Galeopterus variegatus]